MLQFFKTRFFIILLCVAIVLTVVPSVLSVMGLGSVVRNAANTVTMPLRRLVIWIGDGIGGFADYFGEFERIREENGELRQQVAALGELVYDASVQAEENEWLRSYLGLCRENPDFRLQNALIVGRESGNYMTVFTLDAGSGDGIEVNMPVITERGIVGYITEVGLNWSKAATLLEYTSSIGVYCERSGALGLANGSYELRVQSLCTVDYLEANADVAAGDRFVTSGLGGFYPRGLYVGEVTRVYTDSYGRGLVAELSPLVDFSALSRVMILTGFADDAAEAENAAGVQTGAEAGGAEAGN